MAEGDRPPPRPLRPTVMAPPPRRASDARAARPPEAPPSAARPVAAPAGPTAMVGGVERQRIPAAAADLLRLDPGADAGTVEAALRLLAGVVAERANERRAVLWGHEIQTAYADRVAEALDLAGAPALGQARAHVARMIEILGSLDLGALAAREGGALGGVLRGLGGRADTAAEIGAARAELDHLSRLMAGSTDELLTLRAGIERNAGALDALGREAEAASLAALFLSRHLRPSLPAVADRFEERAMSLTRTAAQLRQHRDLREAQVAEPLRLIAAMQDVALVSLPGLLASLAALLAPRAHGRGPTPTEAGEAQRLVREIAQQLKA